MRIVFMATGDIAIPTFLTLLHDSANVVGLVTQPDRPTGRHQTLTPPLIKLHALEAQIPVLQPESLRAPESVAALAALKPDLIIVFSYGQILSQEILDMPSLGCVNLHASLLPRHRGAACIQGAISAGDSEIGVTLMYMVRKLDAGDIIGAESRLLRPEETGGEAHDDLGTMAAALMMRFLPLLENGTAPRTPQDDSLVTYSPKLAREDGHLNWSLPATELSRQIRAFSPWPGTFTTYLDNKNYVRHLKIHPAVEIVPFSGEPGCVLQANGDTLIIACGHDSLLLHRIQPEGSKAMDARAFISGVRHLEGTTWGASS